MDLSPMSLEEFYAETLKKADFIPAVESLEKVAEAQKIDLETAKIANAIFEQLQLDGVPYENHRAAFDDAIKLASAYVDHVKEKTAAAEKLAGDLHRAAHVAIASYLSVHGLDLDVDEGVKIAGLQASSFLQLTQKQAELRQSESKAAGTQYMNANAQPYQTPEGVHLENSANEFAQHTQSDPMLVKEMANSATKTHGVDPGVYWHTMNQVRGQNPGVNDALALHQKTLGALTPPAPASSGKILGMKPGTALGVGALGAGALYVMNKKKREAQAAQQRQNSVASGASLPAA